MQEVIDHTLMTPNTLDQQVLQVAERALGDPTLFIVDVQVKGVDGSRAVEIYVDGDEGVGVDRLAALSREIGFLLDTEDVIDGKYQLIVSSPGADRPLAHPRQYAKHVGRQLNVVLKSDQDAESLALKGALVAVTDTEITLETPEDAPRHIAFDTIQEARVALPW